MKKFILVTESGSDMTQEYIDKHNVYIVPMHINMGEKTYDDGKIKAKDVFNYYDEKNALPSTAGSNPQDFTEIFDEITKKHPESEIIYIAYSAVTTVSYNSANLVAKDYPKLHLVDSKNVSVGLSAIVIAAAEFIEQNPDASAEDVIKFVEEIREKTHFVFLPQTLLYLKAGGRISNASYLGARLLKIFPSIDLINGYLVAGKKYRGSFKMAYKKMLGNFFKNPNINLDTVRLIKVEGLSSEQQSEITQIVEENINRKPEWFDAGAVISCHGGPGAFGIVGFEN